jgi:hypothetical protein
MPAYHSVSSPCGGTTKMWLQLGGGRKADTRKSSCVRITWLVIPVVTSLVTPPFGGTPAEGGSYCGRFCAADTYEWALEDSSRSGREWGCGMGWASTYDRRIMRRRSTLMGARGRPWVSLDLLLQYWITVLEVESPAPYEQSQTPVLLAVHLVLQPLALGLGVRNHGGSRISARSPGLEHLPDPPFRILHDQPHR